MPLAKSDIVAQFQKRFGQSPQWVIRTPNRVNRSLRNDYEVSSDALTVMIGLLCLGKSDYADIPWFTLFAAFAPV